MGSCETTADLFTLRVEGGGSLIQKQNRRVFNNSTGDGDSLHQNVGKKVDTYADESYSSMCYVRFGVVSDASSRRGAGGEKQSS